MINITRLAGGTPSVSAALQAVSHSAGADTRHSFRPLVVLNLTRRCNLGCSHCYLDSADRSYVNELSRREIEQIIDDCQRLEVPVILLSGGEPLLYKDIYRVIAYAKQQGIRVGLSTNGTLISRQTAAELAESGVDYVGISIDGRKTLHDAFRNQAGAFDKAMAGIIHCLEKGIKTGIRFTINQRNAADVWPVIDLCVQEKIPRFCMYHLVYAGRGKALQNDDIDNAARRALVTRLIKTAQQQTAAGTAFEILTVDNHADGIFLYHQIQRQDSARAAGVLQLLRMHGGCSAGTKFVDITPDGTVYPCQFWHQEKLGNVRERSFASLWHDDGCGLLCRLRSKAGQLKGRCGRCRYKQYCGGCRVRAAVVYNDFWAEDPCCYLTDEEIS